MYAQILLTIKGLQLQIFFLDFIRFYGLCAFQAHKIKSATI